MFLDKMSKSRAGDVLTIDLVRDGVRLEQRVTLREMPREKAEGYDVVYGSVFSHGARLRTIITRPSAAGRHSAVMLLQGGHTCFAIDTPVGQPAAFTWIASDLTRHGYVTLRVERPGCGDSEDGRCVTPSTAHARWNVVRGCLRTASATGIAGRDQA